MSYRSKDDGFDIHERKCAGCGRRFVVAPYHSYKLGAKLYCSYTCYMKATRAKEEAHRAKIKARKEEKERRSGR